MKIRDIRTIGLRVPLPRVFEGGTYRITERATIITEIVTDDGVVGRMYTGDTRGDDQARVRSAIEHELRPEVVGEDLFSTERIWAKMFRLATAEPKRLTILMDALSAIDTAIWDGIGKVTGQPVYRLWGGYRDSVPIVAIAGYYEEGKGVEALTDEMIWLREQGMAGVKMKVGRYSIDEDIERFAYCRKGVDRSFEIAADANRAWCLRDAIRFAQGVKDLGLLWLEEPLQWNNEIAGMRRVREVTGVAVTAGQSERSAAQVRDLVDGRAIDHCNVDASHAGGPTEWRRAAAYCALHDVMMAHHEEPQVAMHLLASVPNGGYVECFPNPDRDPLWATLMTNRPRIHDGTIDLPTGPGFGLEFDPDVIARHNVDR
ncbi:MAG: mandelate racemase/muconate lactonizing enzyme family protein [Chloroflexota bacterium]